MVDVKVLVLTQAIATATTMEGAIALFRVEAVMSLMRSRFAEAFEAQQAAENAAAATRRAKAASERRRAERLEYFESGEMILNRTVTHISLLNISRKGMAVRILNGSMPDISDLVSIRLCDNRYLYGSPTWIKGDCFGLEFDAPLEDTGEIIHFENRGAAIYRSLLRDSKQDR